ncbi:MAG: TVP38/TMEM64 family protein [Pseudomonadota bacterium]|nr:TVP38/TMEM64 family protein [Pseudomonadota bacterium]
MNKNTLLKILLLALLFGGGTWLFVHGDLIQFFTNRNKAIDFVNSFGSLSVLAFIGLQILQVLLAPVPGEATGFVGGYIFGAVLGTIYSTIALAIGSWLAFSLARWLGLPFVEKAVSPAILQKYDYFMKHKGSWVVFILFLIPGFPKDALCYMIGLSHMPVRVFLVVSTLGRLLGTAMLSISGDMLRNEQHGPLWILAAVSLLAIVVAYIYRDRLLDSLKHKAPPPP